MKLYKSKIISVTTENGITKTVIERCEKEIKVPFLFLRDGERFSFFEIYKKVLGLNPVIFKEVILDFIKLQAEGWEEIEV